MKKKLLLTTLLASLSLGAFASVQDDFIAKFPQLKDAKIEKSFGDFYSAVRGQEVIFISSDLKTLITGDVIQIDTQKNLAQELRDANKPKINVSELNIKNAIKVSSGSKRIYVFSDPDCPYCKKLERDFVNLSDVEVLVFPMPLAQLHPTAVATSESIWCAKDKARAWQDYVIKGIKPAPATCANPIEKNLAFAAKNQIYGTPAIILPSGEVIPGAMPAATILEKLSK